MTSVMEQPSSQQKPSLSYKLKIHALSHYEIFIYPHQIDITFVMENYKDMNRHRVINKQLLSINRDKPEKTVSYFPDSNHEFILSTIKLPIFPDYNLFDDIFKKLYSNIRDIYNKDKIIRSLRKQKRNETRDDIIKRLMNEIKFHENDKRGYKRNLKHILYPLF